MSYSIQYGPPSAIEAKHKRRVRNKRNKTAAIVLAIAVCAGMLCHIGLDGLRDFLIPGDSEITTAAFETLVGDLREGESVINAVTVFCREIIDGAGIS